MGLRKIINFIFNFRWHRRIIFENDFLFDYQGVGYYYINKTRYKVRKENGVLWIKIDTPFWSDSCPTKSPSNIKVTLQESPEGKALNLEFHASVFPKIFEVIFETALMVLAVYLLLNMVWIGAGVAFSMALFSLIIRRRETWFEADHVVEDLKALCD